MLLPAITPRDPTASRQFTEQLLTMGGIRQVEIVKNVGCQPLSKTLVCFRLGKKS